MQTKWVIQAELGLGTAHSDMGTPQAQVRGVISTIERAPIRLSCRP